MNALSIEAPPPAITAPVCDVGVILPADFSLASGETLSRGEFGLRVYGALSAPVIAVAGGISAGRIVADSATDQGWWRQLVGVGGGVDLEKFCVIGFDFLPGPGECARTITTEDQARALAFALDQIGVEGLHAFVGASYGGMIALAFAAAFPERLRNLCVLSAADRPHPAATALRGVQRRIVEFALRCGDGAAGVSLARQLAMIGYRTPEEFEARFRHQPGPAAGDPYSVCRYLMARGEAYDMAPQRYVTLSDSIDRHVIDAARIKARTLLIAADSDQLVPINDMRRLASCISGSRLVEISSLFGHDAFLKETESLSPIIKSFVEEA